MKKTTILLIDDHTLVRETWSLILNSNQQFEVVGEAGSAEKGIELAKNSNQTSYSWTLTCRT